MQGQDWPSTQDGKAGLRLGRWFFAVRHEAGQSPRGAKAINPKVYPVAGTCVSVSRCKLSSTVVSEDEASGPAHEELQAENARRLSNLQTAYCAMLLPRQTLPGAKVSGSILSKHQAQAQTATIATKVCINL